MRAIARVSSIDIIRGAVIVLMAIDHVRVYSGVPAGGATYGVFFTRWITNFCAPAFIFLAGTSAWFYGRKRTDLSRFLLTRGLWLIFLELTVIRMGWTFNLDFRQYELAGVIWVIGWSMIVLAALSRLPTIAVAIFGVVVIAAHNLLDGYMQTLVPMLGDTTSAALWKLLYVGFWAGPIMFGPDGPILFVLYSLIPWIGVMAAGYAFGQVLAMDPSRRDRMCLAIGLGATALFLVLRGFNLYGDPHPWAAGAPGPGGDPMPALLSFLNTNKYPASLQFLLMTLGPTIALIPWLEKGRGRLSSALMVFGRVPFFFYVLHIPLIHVLALLVSQVRLGKIDHWLFANHPMAAGPAPEGYRWSLALLYAVWALTVALLYFACRWYGGLRARRNEWWLRYL
ncbi:MAG TPA: heparan-alpha-glucosaminide N-acetyltransferase domain-containing protein [Candidatus Krumholzibacteria bacterium]|nr:heparan-alpha-glucosaminide N-acetyltransferase domain-containing protein [Candidatus Krumholzibacteria bacterium]